MALAKAVPTVTPTGEPIPTGEPTPTAEPTPTPETPETPETPGGWETPALTTASPVTGAAPITEAPTEDEELVNVVPLELAEEGEEDEEAEAALDQILAARTARRSLEEDELRGETAGDLAGWPAVSEREPGVVATRRAGEFVCSKCFLVKRNELLADPERRICRDCAM